MKRFLRKTVLFLLLFSLSAGAVFCFHFFVIGNQNQGSFQASILDKLARAQSIREPKILLVGNSNVSLGFDSSILEEAMGMPVVNLGLHGGLGNAFLENMARVCIAPGDIVVLCHIDYDDDGGIPDPALAWITIELHPELWKLVPRNAWGSMLRAYPNYLYSSALRWLTGGKSNLPEEGTSYSRSGFNEYGDVCIRGADSFVFSPGSVQVYGVGNAAVERLNRLNDWVTAQGATLVAAGYPIGDGEFTPEPAEFDKFEENLRQKLNFPVISHFNDYRFPYDCFYDTVFHLNDRGIQLRSEQLAKDLTQWMAQK